MQLQTRSYRSALLALAVAACGCPTIARAADATLARVVMLPLADRTTIVTELTDSVAHVEEVGADRSTVAIQAGPVHSGLQPRELTPAVRSPFVARVSLRGVPGPDGHTYILILVTLRTSCSHHLRIAGSRVYLDLSSPEDELRALRAPAATAPKPGGNAAASAPLPRPADLGSADAVETAYRALESSALRRARELAARPDVKGLLRLHDEVLRRDAQLGHLRPDIVDRVVVDVLRSTDEARALQLERDRRAFLKPR